jgi:hypothetical protein
MTQIFTQRHMNMISIQNMKGMQMMRYQDECERQNGKGDRNGIMVNLTICSNIGIIGIDVRR